MYLQLHTQSSHYIESIKLCTNVISILHGHEKSSMWKSGKREFHFYIHQPTLYTDNDSENAMHVSL